MGNKDTDLDDTILCTESTLLQSDDNAVDIYVKVFTREHLPGKDFAKDW